MRNSLNVIAAVRRMVEASGVSGRGINKLLGKSERYLSTLMSNKRDIQTSTLVNIAAVCGYELVLVNKRDNDDVIVITNDEIPLNVQGQDAIDQG